MTLSYPDFEKKMTKNYLAIRIWYGWY